MKPLSLFILWLLGFVVIAFACIKFRGAISENELIATTIKAKVNIKTETKTETKVVESVRDHNSSEIISVTETVLSPKVESVSVFPPEQDVVTKQHIESHIVREREVFANANRHNMPRFNANNFNKGNNTQMPFWGNNNAPWGSHGFNPPWGNHIPMISSWRNNRFMPWGNQGQLPYSSMPTLPNMLERPIAPVAPIIPVIPISPF